MAKNYVQDGTTMDWTNITGKVVNSGAAVQVGDIVGVAHDSIKAGAVGVLHMCGVFELPKTSSDTWVAGTRLYLDPETGLITLAEDDGATTPVPHPVAGIAWSGVNAGVGTGLVRLGF